ncbi:arsenate reductase (glutaredoxin) [Rhodoferax sp.]|uniref:arsenate reductase (glutaredoxin) n=1 Tax=Rhodoferax sp. TaxID=50421 RepID=UPI00374CD9A9
MTDTTIFHNPACGTSRNVLALIRNSGVEPTVVEYLKTPLDRGQLQALIAQLGVAARAVLRKKGTPYEELGLGNAELSDDALIDAIVAHPILLERPIVITPLGARLCRPSETVLDILANPQQGVFAKEDGEKVVNAQGQRLAS